jgi:hypothetical protein
MWKSPWSTRRKVDHSDEKRTRSVDPWHRKGTESAECCVSPAAIPNNTSCQLSSTPWSLHPTDARHKTGKAPLLVFPSCQRPQTWAHIKTKEQTQTGRGAVACVRCTSRGDKSMYHPVSHISPPQPLGITAVNSEGPPISHFRTQNSINQSFNFMLGIPCSHPLSLRGKLGRVNLHWHATARREHSTGRVYLRWNGGEYQFCGRRLRMLLCTGH